MGPKPPENRPVAGHGLPLVRLILLVGLVGVEGSMVKPGGRVYVPAAEIPPLGPWSQYRRRRCTQPKTNASSNRGGPSISLL